MNRPTVISIGVEPVSHEIFAESTHWLVRHRGRARDFVRRHRSVLRPVCVGGLVCCYLAYLICAIIHDLEAAKALIVITSLVAVIFVYVAVRNHYGDVISKFCLDPILHWYEVHERPLQWLAGVGFLMFVVIYLSVWVIHSAIQLQSLAGMVLCVVLPWITCKHPDQIKWRPVIWGFGLQFIIGILVLRWKPGYEAVRWLSNEINKFIMYSLEGSAKAFGDPWFFLHPFAMLVTSLVVYLGAVMAILQHVGLLQLMTEKMGWFMSVTLHTTAVESLSLATNIFLSAMDTVIMLRSYMSSLTQSELHTLLVGSHSTIAGFAFGIFILFGVSPQHLLTGAVMSAPAAVAIAKLSYPETEKCIDISQMNSATSRSASSVFEAMSQGALASGRGVGAMMVQVIAFFGLLHFCDATVAWLGDRIGFDTNINLLLGYLFMPVAFMLGIEWRDAELVGSLLGLKVLANEFLGYIQLGAFTTDGAITDRSSAIATYAMCGFSSLGSLLMMGGVWRAVCPERAGHVLRLMPRILLNSNLACFMTACLAGIMYTEETEAVADDNLLGRLVSAFFTAFPSYKTFLPSF